MLHTVDPDGTERVLVDPVALDPTGATTLDTWQPSKEGHLLAYQLSVGGTEESVLHVMDVATGWPLVEGPIDRARYSPVAWLPGGEAYYYVRRLHPDLLPDGRGAVPPPGLAAPGRHRPGRPTCEVFGDGLDMTNYYGVTVSMDGRWLVIGASAGTAPRNDLWLADLSDGDLDGAPSCGSCRQGVDASTSLHVGRDGRVYVFTDRDAPRGRLAVTSPDDPAYETWTDLVPEDDEAVLEGWAVLDGAGPTAPRRAAARCCARGPGTRWARSPCTTCWPPASAPAPCRCPASGRSPGWPSGPRAGTRRGSATPTTSTPASVYRYDARTGETTLWATAPGTRRGARGARPAGGVHLGRRHRSCGCSCSSADQGAGPAAADGPLRLRRVRHPDDPGLLRRGCSPGWRPAASTRSPSCAAAREEGEQWHRDGMRDNKQNVFDDFHAAAERLVADGWTTTGQLAISGGSNGGLLVGAALTQRPELYAAVVCSAPLLDMVRYEQFGLGATWSDEYGSAADRRGAGLAAGLLAVPPRPGGRRLPRRAVHGVRRRHPRRPAARPQDVRGPAARDGRDTPGAAPPGA